MIAGVFGEESLLGLSLTVSGDIAEVIVASDEIGIENVIFASLVDDPASVADFVDAYLGEIMLEAASASDTINVAQNYSADVAEPASAADTPDAAITAAIISRSAMVAGPLPVFVNPGASREAFADSVMVNQ